ncbi:MAG: hypothetical protein A2X47_13975 [Lentisphaerae bacterium GWF2_38_69]|nr:MAG: hypothetical protein A2X47_13975 [Lentisphaerae bacterium GWF2_38_69]
MLGSLPYNRKEKALKYIKIEDRYRCAFSWKLLEKVMRDVFSLDLGKESFDIDAYGKPFLTNRNDIHFNLSHSGEIVCCIVDNYPVGIDVENINSIDLNIASNFFSKKECSDLFNLPNKDQINYFYKLWTLKESYIKAEGKGLSIPLNSFSFKVGSNSISFNGENVDKWAFLLHNINTDSQNYQLGICVQKGRLPDKIIEIPYMAL